MMVVPLLSQWSLLCPWMRPEDGRVYAQEAVVNFSKAWCSQLIFLCACGFYFFTFLVYSFIFSCCYFALVKKTHPVNYTVFYLFIFFFSLQLSLITFHTWVQVASARVAQGPQTHRPHSIFKIHRCMTCLSWSKKQVPVLSWFLGDYVSDGLPWWLRWSIICLQHRRPGLGRYSGKGNGYPLQYSCLESSMDRRAPVGYSLWGCKKLDTTEQLTRIHMFLIVNFFFLLGCGDRGGCDACYNLPALLLLLLSCFSHIRLCATP